MSAWREEVVPQTTGAQVLAMVWAHYWDAGALPAADGLHFHVRDSDRSSPAGLFLGSGNFQELRDADLGRVVSAKPWLRSRLAPSALQVLGAIERGYREAVRRSFVTSEHGLGGRYVDGGAFRREIGKAMVAIAEHFQIESVALATALASEGIDRAVQPRAPGPGAPQ